MAKFYLEVHKYSPEQNKIHFYKGGTLSAPYITTIKQAREKLFKQANEYKIRAVIKAVYEDDPLSTLNRSYGGTAKSYKDLVRFINGRRAYHNAGSCMLSIKVQGVWL